MSNVIELGEIIRTDLKMYLETGIACFQHQVVVINIQLVNAIDGELQIIAT